MRSTITPLHLFLLLNLSSIIPGTLCLRDAQGLAMLNVNSSGTRQVEIATARMMTVL